MSEDMASLLETERQGASFPETGQHHSRIWEETIARLQHVAPNALTRRVILASDAASARILNVLSILLSLEPHCALSHLHSQRVSSLGSSFL